MTKTEIKQKILRDFMTRVNKLTLGRSTTDKYYGRVTLICPADHTKGYNKFMNRTGYGTRKFSVRGSTVIPNGKYTIGSLRTKLESVVG